jgi:hypothetical protein
MLANWHGGFFFFFAGCIVVMGGLVWWCVPETKGRTLEGMDGVFGSAYGVVGELGVVGREGRGPGKREGAVGGRVKGDGAGAGEGVMRAVQVVEV